MYTEVPLSFVVVLGDSYKVLSISSEYSINYHFYRIFALKQTFLMTEV